MATAVLPVSCYAGAAASVRSKRNQPARAVLVRATPRSARERGDDEVTALRVRESVSTATLPFRERVGDMHAEIRAMERASDASMYTPELLFSKYRAQPLRVVRRALEILLGLCSFAFALWLDHVKGETDRNRRLRAIQLRETLTRLGPTFVKIGQSLSVRPDLCPPTYVEELSQLQDALPTFPDEEAFSCIERELGYPIDSIFSSISSSPIAAASLGQVYKAQLKCSGKFVAVKVQRPAIEEAIGVDFYLIRCLGFLMNKYVDIITTDVVAIIDEFSRRVFQELNYVQEGLNAKRFKELYADKENVVVPEIFWDYTSGKVLTMEWIEGTKLNEAEAIERQGLKVLDLVTICIQCSLRQLLEYGYFHADPHPGNLLATPDGKLAFIDFGMMSETPEEARSAIIGHVVHMVNKDYEAMARDYYSMEFLSPDVDVSPIVPTLRSFFDDALNSTVKELNFKTIVDALSALLYEYPFNVPPYYALFLRSLTVLEGLALYADPEFKVLAASYPYFAKKLLTDPNPYLRDSLVELLFKDGRFRWNRLENLLAQGRKDRDFNANDVLQPVLKQLLDPKSENLRVLVIKDVVATTEAIILSSADSYEFIPDPFRAFLFRFSKTNPLGMNKAEQEGMLQLRDQVFRVWELLRSSNNFDPSLFLPTVQVLQQPEAQFLGARVVGRFTQRFAARMLHQVLQFASAQSSSPM